ncbi:MAG: protein phosphatase CheZ [Candidatus Adiutrix sp.]|jgi:chemotaxis regulatin CheY-phosphate phosphatase CheZ|nr:protein phosphatase CheZ [Candidatus Adiutrix sp.]
MSSSNPPVIAFELGVGEFRIVTPEAVYQIKVCQDLMEAARAAEGQSSPGGAYPTFFQELSEELFDKIGHLARKLSVSVEELPAQITSSDLDQTDRQLENAKGQLEEIVKITEKASMSIMDSADQIQTDMDQLRRQMDILQQTVLTAASVQEAPSAGAGPPQARPRGRPPASPVFLEKLGELKDYIEKLLKLSAESPPAADPAPAETPPTGPEPAPAAEAAAPAQSLSLVRFDVDVVFQTLYELCTNESVKDHIKLMREAQAGSFNGREIADKLSETAATVDEEDGFYNFPIPTILKILYAATGSEDFRGTLKKMNQTAAGIFLDSVLPIEGQNLEIEIPAAAPPPAAAPVPEAEAPAAPEKPAAGAVCSLDDLKAIRAMVAELDEPEPDSPAPADAGEGAAPEAAENPSIYTSILTRDRDTIVKTVGLAHQLIQRTSSQLTHILETLSFQDLSGQRIMKVVATIGDIQMQLLAILVSFNTKIKVHQESGEDPKSGRAEKMAQEEVDKALEKVGGSVLMGPGDGTRLDQHAVNDLLAQMGF